MKIVILVYPGMTALDAIGPYEVFNSLRRFDIQFAWKTAGPVVTDSGKLVLGATHTLSEITRCDVVLVPGSAVDTLTLMADREVLEWLQALHPSTTFTASVCSGALILGAAGLLKSLPATTHWAGLAGLKQFGAKPEPNKRIVCAGKIITAAGVSAGIDLALYLVAELLSPQQAQIAQLLIEYDPQPPFDSGHMSKADPAIVRQAKLEMARVAVLNPRNLVSFPTVILRQWLSVLKRSRT
ncbi:MAG: DJ-1/PfpI family protein [Chloroflexales bacterium]|nr:DJ-1/PfpI family protein [Chloroflexales bacterium]